MGYREVTLLGQTVNSYEYEGVDFAEIVHDILDDVRSRFELIDAGDLQRRRSGWPEIWTFCISSAHPQDKVSPMMSCCFV